MVICIRPSFIYGITSRTNRKIIGKLQRDLTKANARAGVNTPASIERQEESSYFDDKEHHVSSPQTNINIPILNFTPKKLSSTDQTENNDKTFTSVKQAQVTVIDQAQLDKILELKLASKEKLFAFYEPIKDDIVTPEVVYSKINITCRLVIGFNLGNNP